MTTITPKDFKKAYEVIRDLPIQKQTYNLYYTKEYWLNQKPLKIEWSKEQLDNAIDGYIGEQKGIKCYVSHLF